MKSHISWALVLAFIAYTSVCTSLAAPSDARFSLVAGCRIHKIDGTHLQDFPGKMCLFLDDGRYISANANRLVMYGPDRAERWRINGHFHHQMNWSADGKSILSLGSKIVSRGKLRERVDILRRIDLDGKILAEITAEQIFSMFKYSSTRTDISFDVNLNGQADFEVSHFNSFYEIPKQNRPSANSNIRAGNFIANSSVFGAVIIDSELKKPLERIEFPMSLNQINHDVRVLADGKILLLNNNRKRDFQKSGPQSAIEIYNPVTKKIDFEFQSAPAEMFYTPICGGVEPFGDGELLISHVSNAFFFLEIKSKRIRRSDVLRGDGGGPNLIPVQQINAVELTDFLKKWQ